jgi:hypothetical protein
MEQALIEHHVHHQVVNEHTVTGMQPLVRGLVTVIKVNGDYLSLGMRNTSLELADPNIMMHIYQGLYLPESAKK